MEASIKAINDAIGRGEHTVSLVINEAQPKVAGTATGEELGHYANWLSSETSYFYGSSAERIQNIQAAVGAFPWRARRPG